MTDLLQQALDRHHAGRANEAAELYRQVLRANPERADALYLFGVLIHQNGSHTEAVKLLRRALAAGANQAECNNVLGLALTSLQRYDEAGACFECGLAVQPTAGLYNNLGILRKKQGRLEEAIAAFRQAVAQSSAFADAHYNLGNAYRANGKIEQSAESLQKAVDANAAHADALAALGQVLHALNRSQEAIPFLQRAISLLPNDAGLPGDLAGAWYSAGCAALARKEFAEANYRFREALKMEPNWCEAQHNLAHALFELGQTDEALGLFRQAAAGVHPELPRSMIATVIPGCPAADNAEILQTRSAWAESDLPPLRTTRAPRLIAGGRLRIGYISSFFHRHNWMKPVWGLINRHNRRSFEIHLFSDAPLTAIESGYRNRADDRFYDISGLSNREAAEQIERAQIDLLIDLNGYSKVPRLPLFTLRPAPVIAGWFNMFATTGMSCYDYLIGDSQVIPPEEERFYCEKIVRIRGSYLTFEVTYPVPDVSLPPCLKTREITFGCLAPQYKITSQVIEAWSAILDQAPSANLVLRNTALASNETRRFVHDLFAQRGIAAERIRLHGPADHNEFLERYAEIDVALDTFPYNGGTTTTEAIWQGVPVLTFPGDRWASRTSTSILRAANLDRFVCESLEDYIAQAANMANSPDMPEYLLELRAGMRSKLLESPVCDTKEFARNMEALYLLMCPSR